jgi:hypothetical protein
VVTPSNDENNIENLRQFLNRCASLYLTADLDNQRLATATGLVEVAKFLEARGFPAATLLPIIRPALALAERHNNALDQMFCQRLREGRPNSTMDSHIKTAILSVFANEWLKLKAGDESRQSQKLRNAAAIMRGPYFGQVTGSQLATAREAVSREARDHIAVENSQRFGQLFSRCIETFGADRAFSLMVRYVNTHEISPTIGILKTPPVSPLPEG